MKSKKIYTKLLLAGSLLLMSGSLTSCDDFLTILPTDQLPEEHFWQDKSDLDNVRAGAYEQLTQAGQTNKILMWGELRADNLTLNDMSQQFIKQIQSGVLQPNEGSFDWAGFYTGINFCNLVLEQGEKMTIPGKEVDPSFTRMEYNSIRAEMMALRSLYYFYLVRAYRDVPYITKSVRTDAEAMSQRPAAVPGVAILGECIDSLEANLKYAPDNYGSSAENKGRFTKQGIRALLADMYLWRAGLLTNFMKKDLSQDLGRVNMSDVLVSQTPETPETPETPQTPEAPQTPAGAHVKATSPEGRYTTADGQAINKAYCDELAKTCLQKSAQHAQAAIDYIKQKYDKDLREDNMATEDELNQPYPLYLTQLMGGTIIDEAYEKNFGQQNSRESILELQYDGSTTVNNTVNTYLSIYEGAAFKPKHMALDPQLISGYGSVNPIIGFGRTDLRMVETAYLQSPDIAKPLVKFTASTVSVNKPENMSDADAFINYSTRTATSNNAHWPVYRLADMMLIKAEAIARYNATLGDNADKNQLREGFKLVNQLFKRSNPALVGSSAETTDNDLICDRVNDNYGMNNDGVFTKNAQELLDLLYRERQREFVAEGKRWFDIVRQAEFSNDAKATLNSYTSLQASVKSRLTKMWSLYNPYYSEELKVNGIENGGSLVQNPVWDRYTKK